MKALIEHSTEKVRSVLQTHQEKVNALVEALLDKEELDTDDVAAILGERPEPQGVKEAEAG